VLHYQEGLDTISRKVASAAKTAIEESGTNMLHLTFGFLEWYESDDSHQKHLAPLITLPVTLNRESIKGGTLQVSVERSGYDSPLNLSLIEKMRRDFGLEIPQYDDEETLESYFRKFEPILGQKKRWRVSRQLCLSFLSFGKLLMYRDLDANIWPELLKHRIVNDLFEGRKSDHLSHASEHAIDDKESVPDLPELVVDADSSQHSALIDAARGLDLVIEGPPGTGKSQTITNLIAGALASGKTVLFVSEKLAALEVVRRRLDESGLGIFCLELHSHKTRKDTLLADLAARLRAQGTFKAPRQLDDLINAAEHKKRQLSRYASLMNREQSPIQKTLFEIIWARDQSLQALPFDSERVKGLNLPYASKFSPVSVIEAEQFLAIYAGHLRKLLTSCSKPKQHPWGWVEAILTLEQQEELLDSIKRFRRSKSALHELRLALATETGIELGDTIHSLRSAGEVAHSLPESNELLLGHILDGCAETKTRLALWDFVACAEVVQQKFEQVKEVTTKCDAT
jgi:hypothetical protein